MSLLSMEERFRGLLNRHNSKLKKYIGCRAFISSGKYGGREGIIKQIKFDVNGNAIAMIHPYAERGTRILDKHRDTMKFHIIRDDMLLTRPKVWFRRLF